jgi:phosphoglycolate phosphatase
MAVIFDLDGTLVDSPQGIVKTFMAVFSSMGKVGVEPEEVRATIGMPLEKAFGKLLSIDEKDSQVEQAIKKYQSLFKEIVLPEAKSLVFPGVEKGLNTLKKQGIPLAIATSKVHKSAKSLLDAAGLLDYFDIVVCADHVENRKPHPEMGFLVMDKLGVEAEHTVMVGDTTHDMLMGKESGMHTIAVTYGVHDADMLNSATPCQVVDNFDGVISSIKKLPVYLETVDPYEHTSV